MSFCMKRNKIQKFPNYFHNINMVEINIAQQTFKIAYKNLGFHITEKSYSHSELFKYIPSLF